MFCFKILFPCIIRLNPFTNFIKYAKQIIVLNYSYHNHLTSTIPKHSFFFVLDILNYVFNFLFKNTVMSAISFIMLSGKNFLWKQNVYRKKSSSSVIVQIVGCSDFMTNELIVKNKR